MSPAADRPGGYYNQLLNRADMPDAMRHAAMLNLYIGW